MVTILFSKFKLFFNLLAKLAEKEGFEPSRRYSRPTPFPGEPLRPLGYFSLVLLHFFKLFQIKKRREWDSNPRNALTFAGFQDRCLKPTRPSLHNIILVSLRRPNIFYTIHSNLSITFPSKEVSFCCFL